MTRAVASRVGRSRPGASPVPEKWSSPFGEQNPAYRAPHTTPPAPLTGNRGCAGTGATGRLRAPLSVRCRRALPQDLVPPPQIVPRILTKPPFRGESRRAWGQNVTGPLLVARVPSLQSLPSRRPTWTVGSPSRGGWGALLQGPRESLNGIRVRRSAREAVPGVLSAGVLPLRRGLRSRGLRGRGG